MNKALLGGLWVVVAVLVTGCATTSQTHTKEIEAPSVVVGVGTTSPEIAGHINTLFAPLASRGFVLAGAGEPNSLVFFVRFNPNPYNFQIRVGIGRNGQELLHVEASNAGWGTVLARQAAINNLVEAAAEALDKELRSIRVVALPTKPEASPNEAAAALDEAESYCEQVISDPIIDPIRTRLSLNARPGLAQLVDGSRVTDAERALLIAYSDRAESCNGHLMESRARIGAAPPLMVIWEAERNAKLRNLIELYEGRVTWGQYLQRKVEIEQTRNADLTAIQQELAKQAAEDRQRTAAARQRGLEARQRADQIAAQQATAYAAILQATRPVPIAPLVFQPLPPIAQPLSVRPMRSISCNRIGMFTNCSVF